MQIPTIGWQEDDRTAMRKRLAQALGDVPPDLLYLAARRAETAPEDAGVAAPAEPAFDAQAMRKTLAQAAFGNALELQQRAPGMLLDAAKDRSESQFRGELARWQAGREDAQRAESRRWELEDQDTAYRRQMALHGAENIPGERMGELEQQAYARLKLLDEGTAAGAGYTDFLAAAHRLAAEVERSAPSPVEGRAAAQRVLSEAAALLAARRADPERARIPIREPGYKPDSREEEAARRYNEREIARAKHPRLHGP